MSHHPTYVNKNHARAQADGFDATVSLLPDGRLFLAFIRGREQISIAKLEKQEVSFLAQYAFTVDEAEAMQRALEAWLRSSVRNGGKSNE